MIAACTMVRNWVRRNRVFGLARLHHIDGHELLLGIDPEGRAGGARPAMFAHRALDRRITQPRVDLEAQAETEAVLSARPGADMIGRHECKSPPGGERHGRSTCTLGGLVAAKIS